MKNILIIIGLILTSFINSNSQNFEFGIKTGFGIANVHWTNIDDKESVSNISPTFSYSINGIINYKSKGFWGFSIEPGIIKKGLTGNDNYPWIP